MKFKKENRLITAALPYVNNVPHLGNIVGSHLPADIFARYCRLVGHNCVFVGGTDEHGTATEVAAIQKNTTPQRLCDFYYKIHREIYNWFNFSYDNFSRTSRGIHHKFTQSFFIKVYKNGFLKEDILVLPFCKNCNRQLSDRYIEGKCPYCHYENARGDQCEKCSKLLDPANLKNPKCVVCNSTDIEFKEEKHLFLDLTKLSTKLERWIKSNKHWRPQVRNMAFAWLKEGLKPRCITRNLKWGIKVPIKGYEDKVFYVWAEAAIGYISATKEWHNKKWKEFWLKKRSKIYHFIGKDNIPFHTILFPAELIAHKGYNLPYNVVGLQYLNFEGGKFSKSKERGVFCENLPNTNLSSDYWRFYLSFTIPETGDTDFSWDEFKERINKELVDNFGNFINRVLKFTWNNFNKKIPLSKGDHFINTANKQIDKVIVAFEKVELRKAMQEILRLSDLGNKYFDKTKPWKTKDKTAVFNCANLCKVLGLLINPFLPATSEKILKMLNCSESNWDNIKRFNLKNHKINEPEILFHKIEDCQIEELKQKTSKVTKYSIEQTETIKNTQTKPKPMIKYEEFQKLEIKVGKIKSAKEHPNADKLLILEVDTGDKLRQIVAGLKGHYKPEELKGKEVIVLTNLEPRDLRGFKSEGMLLAAIDGNKVVALTVDKDVKAGSEIK